MTKPASAAAAAGHAGGGGAAASGGRAAEPPAARDAAGIEPPAVARVRDAAAELAARLDARGGRAALILGSGLSGVTERLAPGERGVPYDDIPGFPLPTVAGHAGQALVARVGAHRLLIFAGRVHGYEGHPASEVTFFVRVAAALNIPTLIVTNASGGIDPALVPGRIVAISDHLNLTGGSPLTGTNHPAWGPRFPDMTDAYARALRDRARRHAEATLGYALAEAVYAGVTGPAYETPAEVRMLRGLGAGLVGMSTVHEVIAARHAGLEVLGLSIVANHAAGVVDEPLRHEDVTRAAAGAADGLARLVAEVVRDLPPVLDGGGGALALPDDPSEVAPGA